MSDKQTNEEQRSHWNEQAGAKWVESQQALDSMLGPLGTAAIEAVAPQPGESALDIGCGCGDTTFELARRIAPLGTATGFDISAPMLAHARLRALDQKLENVQFVEGDAQTFAFEAASFDLLFSRFGVMFFEDPEAAFANMRTALKPDGRMAFVCWQGVLDNPWMMTSIEAAAKHVRFDPPDPQAPGPFAFANPDRVRSILGQAGFRVGGVDGYLSKLRIGSGLPLETTVDFLMRLGPVGRMIGSGDIDQATSEAIAKDLHARLQPLLDGDAVAIDSATWIVTATVA